MRVSTESSLDDHTAGPDPNLAVRVRGQSDLLARRMVADLRQEIAFYAHLPEEQIDGDILAMCRHNIATFSRVIGEGTAPTPSELEAVRSSAVQRAEEGVPLEALLRAYFVGLAMLWEHFNEEAAGDEREELLAVATAAMRYIELVTSLVTQAYLEEHEVIAGARRDLRRSLVDALLNGRPPEDLAAQAGIVLHPGYAVVAMALGPSVDEGRPEVEGRVAARRKVRRVSSFLEARPGPECLAILDVSGGVLLLPLEDGEPPDLAVTVPVLLNELEGEARCPILAGYSWHPGLAGVVDASAEARSILHLAEGLGLPPAAYRRENLLFEYALSRDPASLSALSALLVPLEQCRADLGQTIRTYFDCQFDRSAAAKALHVHPNTLDYRLRRVRQLSGIDVTTASGLSTMRAALVARQLCSEKPT